VLCLDTEKPSGPVAFSRGLWHGAQDAGAGLGLRNRWVDKPVQFIVFDNGQAGIMGEHSIMDGTPTARMCDDVLDALYSPTFDHGSSAGASTPPAPVALDWRVSKATQDAIARAEGEARELIGSQELGFYRSPYGKAAIKAFGVSPDSWAQMIIQLAYARLLRATGKQREGGTYEAATTRKFLKGRTEAIRVVSAESDAWVAAMDDAGHGRAERKALFDKATKKHIERAKEAGNGQGVDRHLLGTLCGTTSAVYIGC
jgi:carnitine O-acetyltransferase